MLRYSLTVTNYKIFIFFRYLIGEFEGGSLLRIEPVRKKRESGAYECVAENGVGDEVSASAQLTVYDGVYPISNYLEICIFPF